MQSYQKLRGTAPKRVPYNVDGTLAQLQRDRVRLVPIQRLNLKGSKAGILVSKLHLPSGCRGTMEDGPLLRSRRLRLIEQQPSRQMKLLIDFSDFVGTTKRWLT